VSKAIAPVALQALKEALTDVYWYKQDLWGFVTNTISDSCILARLNWDAYKRTIVTTLVDDLARNQERHQEDLLKLIVEVTRIDDFTYLRQLEDGQ
jgi:hypothetical protein